jgi:spoIIIJ-associated protein
MNTSDLAKIEELLKPFSITSDQIKVEEEGDIIKIIIDLDELEAGRLIGRFASTLDSLQLIISLMLNKGETHKHVLLDVAGYRERRLQTLETMVENAKHQTRDTGASCVLPPLSATERRQVHLMLQDDAEFTSFSEGHGQDRRLFIALKNA